MDSFQIIVLLIATVVLILMLTVIGINLTKNKNIEKMNNSSTQNNENKDYLLECLQNNLQCQ